MRRVVILQEYIPTYRVPFFQALHERAALKGIDLVVACGQPDVAQGMRGDAASLDFAQHLSQREWSVLGRRLVIRRIASAVLGADLVILEQARRNLDAYRLLRPWRRDAPLVALWGHGRDFTRATKAIDRFLRRWLTLRSDWFFAYTSGGVDAVVADGFPRSRTTLVQNSIDTTSLRESISRVSIETAAAFQSSHDLRGRTALFIGALDDSKRLPFLVQAAVKCHEFDPDFRLLIAGDGALRSAAERWASQYGWLTYLGPVGLEAKAVALASAQVLAMPGRVGLVAVDSFGAGIPIVTTDWSWHAPEFEYLKNGHNAIVSVDRISDYSHELTTTLGQAEMLSQLRAACLRDGELVTITRMADNFLEGIVNTLESGPS